MTQVIETPKMSAWRTTLLLAKLVAVVVAVGGMAWWFLDGSRPVNRATLRDVLLKGLLCWALLLAMEILTWQVVQNGIRKLRTVLEGHSLCHGQPIACQGDAVRCNLHGLTRIAEGSDLFEVDDCPVAQVGHRCACGCTLVSSMPDTSVAS